MSCAPVLLVLFNREDTTSQVFEAIRRQRPAKLFISADGPRLNVPGEAEACQRARAVVDHIDWPCEVHKRFLTENVGCARGVSEAISWFFDHVDEGIIFEDDCLPDPSFFRFATEILEKYRNEPRIMHISGNNFLFGKKRGNASYYFSHWTHNWGWATWKRAWKYFDINLLPESERKHIWDAQWRMSVEKRGGLAIAPNVNLVSNIGCGRPDATHTYDTAPEYASLRTQEMIFPLSHPAKLRKMDRYTDYTLFRGTNSFHGLFVKPAIYCLWVAAAKTGKALLPNKLRLWLKQNLLNG
ncbi:MAG: hypothetical protein ACJ763_04790 [Bdellovibrionia bacterium]